MKKKIITIFLFIIFIFPSCDKTTNIVYIGKVMNEEDFDNYDIEKTENIIYVTSSQYTKGYKYNNKNVSYDIGVDNGLKIIYIGTNSLNFKTRDGLKIDDTLEKCLKKSNSELYVEIGWGYYLSLPSGWLAVLDFYSFNPKDYPPPDTKIKLFCKKIDGAALPFSKYSKIKIDEEFYNELKNPFSGIVIYDKDTKEQISNELE